MVLSKNGNMTVSYDPVYEGKQIVIAIDSSKSNSAIAVGDPYGNIYDDYEISGAGEDTDVYQLCWDTRKVLKGLFLGAEILSVGIEDIITKESEYAHTGMDVHMSRKKITAVFDNFIFIFQEYYDIMPRLIPNQSWKAATLPEEFRKRTHKKGSKDYFDSIGGRWAGRKDDVTDAVCIYNYICQISNFKVPRRFTEICPADKSFVYGYYPESMSFALGFVEVEYNDKFTLEQNINTMVTMVTKKNKCGYMLIPIEVVPLSDIYSDKMKRSYDKVTNNVYCVVKIT